MALVQRRYQFRGSGAELAGDRPRRGPAVVARVELCPEMERVGIQIAVRRARQL